MSLFILCSQTRTPRLWDVIRGNSCIKSPGCIHLITFVDLVRDREGQYLVEYYLLYLESVEEYSKRKIQLLHLNITSQCDNI